MKAIILSSTLLLCCLFTINSFGQQITYKDLIGTWRINDSTGELPSISFKFKDNSHVILSVAYEGTETLTYTLNTSHYPMELRFKGVSADNKKMDDCWLLKVMSDGTIKAEEPTNSKWNDNEAITMVKNNDNDDAMVMVKGK
jgi:hypothetical protein